MSADITPAGRRGPPAVFGWLVHLFTASGAVLALLSLQAIEEKHWRLALLSLFVALIVDGIDGSFARWARVKENVPEIDGDTLDLVVDYLTYVFIPTLFIWHAGLVPGGWAPYLAAAILVSSLYLFSRSDMKTQDNYFRGFPALWNMVAFYLYAVAASPLIGAIVVCSLVALTFAPVHFVHPFRVRDYGHWLPGFTVIWAAATSALLWPRWTEGVRVVLLFLSFGSALILLGMGVVRSIRGQRATRQDDVA